MKKFLMVLVTGLFLLLSACVPAQPAIPQEGQRIVSMAPATTEILIGLGLADAIVACDSYSQPLLAREALIIDAYDITKPNMEAILTVNPTLVFASEINQVLGENPFAILSNSGAQIEYLPTAQTLDDVADSIRLVGQTTGRVAEAERLALDMLAEIEEIRALTAAVETRRSVYFEIDAAPRLYSFGANTFMNELLLACNAQNVFSEMEGWFSPAAEAVFEKNPDVILTNIGYIDGIIEQIKSRDGFAEITAVKNNAVYLIDPDASARPSQHIVKAIRQIAEVVYPELFN